MNKINSDIYQINKYLNNIKANHISVEDSNSLMLGIFGYLGDVFSNQIQDNIILSSRWSDEIFPIRAKLEKNLLTHAMMANITDFNAIPARMDMLIGVREADLLKRMKSDTFFIDKDIPIYIGDYEFHIEQNINIFRQLASSNKNIYIAQYELEKNNKLSTISNPYLLPPVKTKMGNEDFIFIRARIRQTELSSFHKKIISTSDIDNKTFEFEFENQLADFHVDITTSSGEDIKLIPIYEDSPIIDSYNKYVYYSYINSNTVRVKFIKSIFTPSINDEINVKIITTKGVRGNFTYKDNIIIEPKSNKYNYSELLFLGIPVTDSEFGEDKKSVDDLKRIIPRELLSRGSITCSKDLENYFNIINDKFSILKFDKKIDNQFERTYYSYMLLKDDNDNIIPTNTVSANLKLTDFNNIINDRYVLHPGTPLEYDSISNTCNKINPNILTTSIIRDKEINGFLYSSPFTIVVNKSPLVVSHYLTIFNRNYNLIFKQISSIPLLQFISTKVKWRRDLVVDKEYYKMDIEYTQNIDDEYGLVSVDDNGFIDPSTSKIKIIGVMYNDDNEPFRYIEGLPIHYNSSNKTYKFRFKLQTNDDITRDSKIKITNLKETKTGMDRDGYFNANNCKFDIYVLSDLGNSHNNRGSLDHIVPGLDGYSLCNIYSIEDGLDFFINFSDIVSSVVRPIQDGDSYYYKIDDIPVVRYSHLTTSNKVKYLINYIMDKKVFIDSAINVLENSFGIDFKFFNTYGKSRINMIGQSDELLDRVNISLTFKVKFNSIANNESFISMIKKEIKTYIEDIYEMSDVHISNIIMMLKNKFSFISYIEFVKFNHYDTIHQSIIEDISKLNKIPEFINVGSKDIEYEPDIDIIVL